MSAGCLALAGLAWALGVTFLWALVRVGSRGGR
jgi:hypothetical protein